MTLANGSFDRWIGGTYRIRGKTAESWNIPPDLRFGGTESTYRLRICTTRASCEPIPPRAFLRSLYPMPLEDIVVRKATGPSRETTYRPPFALTPKRLLTSAAFASGLAEKIRAEGLGEVDEVDIRQFSSECCALSSRQERAAVADRYGVDVSDAAVVSRAVFRYSEADQRERMIGAIADLHPDAPLTAFCSSKDEVEWLRSLLATTLRRSTRQNRSRMFRISSNGFPGNLPPGIVLVPRAESILERRLYSSFLHHYGHFELVFGFIEEDRPLAPPEAQALEFFLGSTVKVRRRTRKATSGPADRLPKWERQLPRDPTSVPT